MTQKISRYFIVLYISILFYHATYSWQKELKALINNAHNATPTSWIHEGISTQLAPFKNGITREMLDKTSAYSREIARFTIINGTVYSSLENTNRQLGPGISPGGIGYHLTSVTKMNVIHKALEDLISCVSIPDTEFLLSLTDGTISTVHCPGPLYAFSKHQHENHNVILLPDPDILKNHMRLQKKVLIGNKRYPWEEKSKKIFWRGGSNDTFFFSLATFMESPRYKLVLFAQNNPTLADALFSDVNGSRHKVRTALTTSNLIGEYVSIEDHMAYAYQVVIDGFTAAWARTYWQLFCNSVMFKQESDNIQWYFPLLQPYIHYIPLMPDISDIEEKLDWAKQHPTEVHAIIKNANQFAHNNLTYPSILYYIYVLLTEYAQLQQFEPLQKA